MASDSKAVEYIAPRGFRGDIISLIEILLKTSRSSAKELLNSRSVILNGRRVVRAKELAHGGDKLIIVPAAEPVELNRSSTLLITEAYVVVNKPPGLLVNDSSDCVEKQLQRLLEDPNITAVHRLDRDTSGCVVFARGKDNQRKLDLAFSSRKVYKEYRTLVAGPVPRVLKKIEKRLDGKEAHTEIEIIKSASSASHLKVILHTGRTHQIRRHLALVGFPVLGDREYTSTRSPIQQFLTVPRQMLHSYKLEFPDPTSGKLIKCKAPLPDDFLQWSDKIGLKS